MPIFVILISHGFTFVIWAVICPTSEIWPFVGQFFCSLYLAICETISTCSKEEKHTGSVAHTLPWCLTPDLNLHIGLLLECLPNHFIPENAPAVLPIYLVFSDTSQLKLHLLLIKILDWGVEFVCKTEEKLIVWEPLHDFDAKCSIASFNPLCWLQIPFVWPWLYSWLFLELVLSWVNTTPVNCSSFRATTVSALLFLRWLIQIIQINYTKTSSISTKKPEGHG